MTDPLHPTAGLPQRPAVDHGNDPKAWLLTGIATLASIGSILTFGWAMAYDAPVSFSTVAQQELAVPELADLTVREAQDVGRGLCTELSGSDETAGLDVDALSTEVARRYTISRSTSRELVDAAITHICPEAVSASGS